jgi:hypothetical protein
VADEGGGARCYKRGHALRRAIESYPDDISVAVLATGGLSHQVHGERSGFNNVAWDKHFLELITRARPVLMFTRSPTTGDRSVITIEGAWGMVSAMVGGVVTPDRWVAGKSKGRESGARHVGHGDPAYAGAEGWGGRRARGRRPAPCGLRMLHAGGAAALEHGEDAAPSATTSSRSPTRCAWNTRRSTCCR